MTAIDYQTEWASQAVMLRMFAEMWRREGEKALTAEHGMGELMNLDYGVALNEGFQRLSAAALSYAEQCQEIANAQDATAGGQLVPCAGDCPADVA